MLMYSYIKFKCTQIRRIFIRNAKKDKSGRKNIENLSSNLTTSLKMSIPIVTVKQGKLKGAVIENILGSSSYYAFRGIPFATPPVGELRFKVST